MQQTLAPHFISEQLLFPGLPFYQTGRSPNSLPAPDFVYGQVSRDGLWSWIAKDAVLDVVSTTKRERYATWDFAALANDPGLCIISVKEFVGRKEQSLSLVVALGTNTERSMLVLLDIKTSTILKLIEIPGKVSCIEVVAAQGGALVETQCLCQELRYMFGIVAVGLHTGRILLVDLCTDEKMEMDKFECNPIIFITTKTHNVAGRRENAILHCQHLCLSLNDDAFHRGVFYYRSEDGNLLDTGPAGEVFITSLKYIHQLNMLAIGFNFGGFQLWNLQTMALEYTSFQDGSQPVIQFAFQEPENDPRNFCYLWTVKGQAYLDSNRPDCISVAKLYSLTFEKKEWLNSYGFVYKNLNICTSKFELPLVIDPFCLTVPHGITSRLVTCYSIQQSESSSLERSENDSLHDWNNQDLSLCVLVWETWMHPKTSPSACYLALFDINQWYQARMPVFPSGGKLCPYLGLFSLTQVEQRIGPETLLDVHLKSTTLAKFRHLSASEQFYYPSSLSFTVTCLTEKGVTNTKFLGIQRLIFSKMTAVGPECLVDSKEIFSMCLLAGLCPLSLSDSCDISVTSPVHVLREHLLTLALEHGLFPFITSCVNEWSTGAYSHVGCTAKTLLDWLWKRVTYIKNAIDRYCIPLFNCTGQKLDQHTLRILNSYHCQLKHIYDIIDQLISHGGPLTEQGQCELNARKEAVNLIAIYLKAILCLYRCRLLPEHLEGDAYGEDEVACPTSLFTKMYEERRQELSRLHSTVQKTDILLIDGMVASMGPSLSTQWEKLGGGPLYPPPTLHALISMYLLDSVSLIDKHMLMLYFLLDMTAFLSDKQSHLVEKIMRFPAQFNLNSSHVKITQGFWLLDHKDYQEALSNLLHPMADTYSLQQWQYTRIVKAFLYQGEHKKALSFSTVRAPPVQTLENVKLHLTVLLANRLIPEAFDYLRRNKDEQNMEDLLNYFFLGCEQTHSLNLLLQMPFSKPEEETLIEYLQDSTLPHAKEIIVLYLLQRNSPLDAAHMNDKIKQQSVNPKNQTNTREPIRNAIVQGFLKTLPNIQVELAKLTATSSTAQTEVVVSPIPISSFVHTSSLSVVSQSVQMKMIMEQIDSLRSQPVSELSPFVNRSGTRKRWTAEDFSFIQSPVIPTTEERLRAKEVIYATPVRKEDSMHHLDQEEAVSPAKRRRYMDVTPFRLQDSWKRRGTNRIFDAEIQAVLQSTPVRQKSPTFSSLRGKQGNIASITPQSILKVRHMMRRPASPLFNESICSSQPERIDVEKGKKLVASEQELNEEPMVEDDSIPENSQVTDSSIPENSQVMDSRHQASSSLNEQSTYEAISSPEVHKEGVSGLKQLIQSTHRLHEAVLLSSDSSSILKTPESSDIIKADEDVVFNMSRVKHAQEISIVTETVVSKSKDSPRTPSPLVLHPNLKAIVEGPETPPLENINSEEEDETSDADTTPSFVLQVSPKASSASFTPQSAVQRAEDSSLMDEKAVVTSPELAQVQELDKEPVVMELIDEEDKVMHDEPPQLITVETKPSEILYSEPPELQVSGERIASKEMLPELEISQVCTEYQEQKQQEDVTKPVLISTETNAAGDMTSMIRKDNLEVPEGREMSQEFQKEPEGSKLKLSDDEDNDDRFKTEQRTEQKGNEEYAEKRPFPKISSIIERESTPERTVGHSQDSDKSPGPLRLSDEDSVSIPDLSKPLSVEPSSPYLGTRSRTRAGSVTPEGKQGSEASSRTSSPATPKGSSSRTSSPAAPRVSPRTKEKEAAAAAAKEVSSPPKKSILEKQKIAPEKILKQAAAVSKKSTGNTEPEKSAKSVPESEASKIPKKIVPSKVLKVKKKLKMESQKEQSIETELQIETVDLSKERKLSSPIESREGRKGDTQRAASAVLKKTLKKGQKKDIPRFIFSKPIVSGDSSAPDSEAMESSLPSPAFIFSPPVTRSKARRKKPEEPGSSMAEEPQHQPFIDPLLITEARLSGTVASGLTGDTELTKPSTSSATRNLAVKKTKRILRQKKGISPAAAAEKQSQASRDSSAANQGKSPTKHSMALRRTRFRTRKVTKM